MSGDEEARAAAMRAYAAAFDRWSEQEQLLRLEGRAWESEGAHEMARICLAAWLAESRERVSGESRL